MQKISVVFRGGAERHSDAGGGCCPQPRCRWVGGAGVCGGCLPLAATSVAATAAGVAAIAVDAAVVAFGASVRRFGGRHLVLDAQRMLLPDNSTRE